MGLSDRLRRLWSRVTGKPRSDDPRVVIQAALDDLREQYRANRDGIAGLLKQRDQVRDQAQKKELAAARARQLAREAVRAGDDGRARLHLEEEKVLEETLAVLRDGLTTVEREASRAREAMMTIQSEVERLERDRAQMDLLSRSGAARTAVRRLRMDLDERTASPSLDRARSEIELRQLSSRYETELAVEDEQRDSDSVDERLRALKDEL